MTTSAQVYYRKWRPGTFSDLAGQEHVGNTLRQAVTQDRVSHSYLFCGTRGSGKTTTARVLAKAVNCLNPQQGDPCDECAICISINEGRNLDIIELDAASNRGVEEIREIREKVNFQPAQNRRKVYIIDEAHMLTREASNAFLKTLEEPPEHVIFILCTTEADRLLPTILSRCQRYDFRRLPGQTIYDRLAYITDQEAIAIHPDALRMIARNAGGSMRDALNILEQLAVSSDGDITLRDVEESLGLVRSDAYLALAQKLLAGDTTGSLETINEVVWEGGEPPPAAPPDPGPAPLHAPALLGRRPNARPARRYPGRTPCRHPEDRLPSHPARRSHLGRGQRRPPLRRAIRSGAGDRRRRNLPACAIGQ